MSRQRLTAFLAIALALCLSAVASMQAPVMAVPRLQFFANDGNPCSSCTLTTYLAGTTTSQVVYTNSALSAAAPAIITLNTAGRPSVSGTEVNLYQPAFNMKYVLASSAGTVIWTADNVRPTASGLVLPSTFAVGDILYADTTSTMARLAASTSGYVLTSNGAAMAPSWQASPVPTTFAVGDILYANTTSTLARLAASTSGLVLTANGAAQAPSWQAGSAVDRSIVQGRLTLTTATPVTTADVTAATTLYFALYGGNQISLYTGSAWTTITFAQLSIAVPATTSQMYDVFVDYTAGTPVLEAVAWTNDTTRAVALATQDGVYVQTSDADSRYVGSFRTTGVSGQTEDSFAKRYVWNYYNRAPRPMRVVEATNSWTYSVDTYQQANAAAGNQLDFVIGVSESPVQAAIQASAYNDTGAGNRGLVAIGLDSTTTAVAGQIKIKSVSQVTNVAFQTMTSWAGFPGVGRHTLVWLEYANTTGITTWFGDDGNTALTQSGISGWIEG